MSRNLNLVVMEDKEDAYFQSYMEPTELSNPPPTEPANWFDKLLNQTLPVLTSTYQARELNKINISRVNSGLPALTAEEYARTYQPPAANVTFGPDSTAKKLLVWGGLGLGAYFALKALKVIR